MSFANHQTENTLENSVLVREYNLPDFNVLGNESDFGFTLWQPDDIYVILGRANNSNDALHSGEVLKDGVKVYKRPSGGESVVLSPRMLVFSAKFKNDSLANPKNIFRLVNNALIRQFTSIGITGVHSKGISDLSIGNRKILGSSMYLNGKTLFYHAVLNISEDVSIISKYLKHPSREPDYREGRPHHQFVTSIHQEGFNIDNESIKTSIEAAFGNLFKELDSYVN